MAEVVSYEIQQYRFYNFNSDKNQPQTLSAWNWVDGDDGTNNAKDLLTQLGAAVKIGIQTIPGVKFYLNTDSSAGIIIDHTGVYELDLTDTTTTISTLFFDPESLILIDKVDNASLIVDIMYKPTKN